MELLAKHVTKLERTSGYVGAAAPTGGGRIESALRVASTPFTAGKYNYAIFVDTDNGAITVNLPAGIRGTCYKIVNCGGATNDVTINPHGPELLFGSAAGYALTDGLSIDICYEPTEGWW